MKIGRTQRRYERKMREKREDILANSFADFDLFTSAIGMDGGEEDEE